MSVTITPYPIALKVFRLRDTAVLPTFATPGSMCFDLAIALNPPADHVIVRKGEVTTVGTGWQFQMPPVFGMIIVPRSGMGRDYGLVLANTEAIIDNDYTGEVLLALTLAPHAPTDELKILDGQRVAQARFQPIVQANFRETRYAANATQRGAGGFGSTGVA